MTQLRFHPGSLSNYFDRILDGIGHRGSSFSDIDAVSHDKTTKRFLVQEFKREGEPINWGQHWMLRDLAEMPNHFTVWHVMKRNAGDIGWAFYGDKLTVITVEEYQARFRRWWENAPLITTTTPQSLQMTTTTTALTADDIRW